MTTPIHAARHSLASSKSLISWIVLVLAVTTVPTAQSQEGVSLDELPLTFSLQATSEVVLTGDATCPLKLLIEGAGLTSLLGPIHDNASHCIRADGSSDHGLFKFTGATLNGAPGGADSQDSISGQYVAHIVPTPRSVFPTTPAGSPGGYWLVYEEFCVSGGTGKFANIANDCPTSTSAGRFFAARGSVDLDTGQANIYGAARVHLDSE